MLNSSEKSTSAELVYNRVPWQTLIMVISSNFLPGH